MQHGGAVFLLVPRLHFAAQLVDQGLHPVANTQDRQPAFKDPIGY